jgi:hypothetical protein
MATPAKPPTTSQNVINPLTNRDNVKQFRDTDFTINSRELICLNFDDCILILFYNNNVESTNLSKIWVDASSQTPGFIFGAVNLQNEKKIAENFAKLNQDPNHPYHWAALRQTPFILVYRKGWPTAFYNGSRSSQAIIDYTMTLACRADYHEHDQKGWSLQAVSNIEMTNTNRYDTEKYGSIEVPPRTSSENYNTKQPMRYSNIDQTRVVDSKNIDTSFINTSYDDIKSASKPPNNNSTTQPKATTTTNQPPPNTAQPKATTTNQVPANTAQRPPQQTPQQQSRPPPQQTSQAAIPQPVSQPKK